MKNVASLKTSNTNSPKTPGGISKSLLTPCRRLGLSRNWKKSGPSPFISPLTSNADGNKDECSETNIPASPNVDSTSVNLNVDTTPTRNVALPRKRKSKTLLAAITCDDIKTEHQNVNLNTVNDLKGPTKSEIENEPVESIFEKSAATKVSTSVRVKSKAKSKKLLSDVQTPSEDLKDNIEAKDSRQSKEVKENINNDLNNTSNDKSPNELKKKCIVVIQSKIFKDEGKNHQELLDNTSTSAPEIQCNTTSQTLFDSDSDDMPLCELSKAGTPKSQIVSNEVSQETPETILVNEDDDFIEHKSKIRKIDTSNKEKQKNNKKTNLEPTKIMKGDKPDFFDDDEDFEFDNKKTILIRKSYDKVSRPLKMKSTGSITQKDIDELKARIEVKKKLLLAKTITEDTKELRDLIKKWQKGCQDALMDLMELMKRKFPEKSNMDYSEILESLHIPATLVGYDSENDCFNTPDDSNIIFSHI